MITEISKLNKVIDLLDSFLLQNRSASNYTEPTKNVLFISDFIVCVVG